MKRPVAIDLDEPNTDRARTRAPRAFDASAIADLPVAIDSLSDPDDDPETAPVRPRRMGWLGRILWATASLLISLALGLAADNLIRSLFAANPWLGWLGLGILGLFLVALTALIVREATSLIRLRTLDHLKTAASDALAANHLKHSKTILAELKSIYETRPDLARARTQLAAGESALFDGAEIIRFAERTLMTPLDTRARVLTAASARRVALVTAISPRALVDIAFVVWESVRLGGAIARLYGARPGFFGTWRLIGAILGHLAVTGGLVLTDGVIEQLVGQGLAARLSQKLGEGVVNGLMTVRVGIAAMRVVRPLPFATQKPPAVKDFLPELASVLKQPPAGHAP